MRFWIEDHSALAVSAPPPKQAVRVAAGVPGKPPPLDLIQVQSTDDADINTAFGHVIVWDAPPTLVRGEALALSNDGTALVTQTAGVYEASAHVAQGNERSESIDPRLFPSPHKRSRALASEWRDDGPMGHERIHP